MLASILSLHGSSHFAEVMVGQGIWERKTFSLLNFGNATIHARFPSYIKNLNEDSPCQDYTWEWFEPHSSNHSHSVHSIKVLTTTLGFDIFFSSLCFLKWQDKHCPMKEVAYRVRKS